MVGGRVDWRALAERHRPRDSALLAAEVRRQAACGLKARDIATALRIDLAVVAAALADGQRSDGA